MTSKTTTPVVQAGLRERLLDAISGALPSECDMYWDAVADAVLPLLAAQVPAVEEGVPARGPTEQSTGVAAIAEERARQMAKEGWTPEHDDEHVDGSLAEAAACYAWPMGRGDGGDLLERVMVRNGALEWERMAWPWDNSWDKRQKHDRRRRRLIIAGALIAAEIDRLDRAAKKGRIAWCAKTGMPPGAWDFVAEAKGGKETWCRAAESVAAAAVRPGATPTEGVPPPTDLDRKIATLLAEADKRTSPGPLANGGELIRDLAGCLRIVLQEQEDGEAAWASEHEALLAAQAEVEMLRAAAQRLLAVAMPHAAVPREMAVPISAFDELRRAVEKEAGQ